jgi:RHS repeat-associated protein
VAGRSYFLNVLTAQTWNILLELQEEETLATFVYDGDGGRVKRIAPSEIVTYIGSSYELQETIDGIRIKKHIYMGSTRVCTVEYDEATPETLEYYFFHQDHIGSSNVITDKDGNIAQLIEYTPYGLTARDDESYNYDTDCLYTGKLFDTSTELYYYGARYYDPELGHFITPDTIVPYPDDPQSFNRYSYARCNPIRYVDPTGHSWFSKLIGAIVGIVVGALTGQVELGLAAYSFVDSAISAYQAGANIFQAIGIGVVSGSASYLGGRFGFDYMGGEIGAFLGASFFGSIGSSVGTAAIMGGDIGRAAVAGVAGGAASIIGTPIVGSGVASEIQGGSFGEGALEGLYGTIASYAVVSSAISSSNWTAAQDVATRSSNQPSSLVRLVVSNKIIDYILDLSMKSMKKIIDKNLPFKIDINRMETDGVAEVALSIDVKEKLILTYKMSYRMDYNTEGYPYFSSKRGFSISYKGKNILNLETPWMPMGNPNERRFNLSAPPGLSTL